MKIEKQITILQDELAEVRTEKVKFLEQMERLIPWDKWEEIIRPVYYKGERGQKPYPLMLMLRIYVIQNLYNLSDMGTVSEVIDSRAFSDFCGVTNSNQVPDGDTLGRFRNLLIANNLQAGLFEYVVKVLRENGLILRKGTIVDSTIIEAPSSTKNKEKSRDPEAHQTKKGNMWHFGYKVHVGVDRDSGLVHTVVTTSANVSDVTMVPQLISGDEETVHGDSGYLGADKRVDAIQKNQSGKKIRYKINLRPSQIKTDDRSQWSLGQRKRREREKSSIRAKVEHVFAVVKNLFRYRKTRYRGQKKNAAALNMRFALANLLLADRQSLAA